MLPLLFAKLHQKTRLSETETAKLQQHAATIKTRLQATFRLVKILQIGSFPRETCIREHSDLDLLAVFSRSEAKRGRELVRSTGFVDAIRNDLRQRYQRTAIRRDGQAVAIEFGAGTNAVDVVPAIYWEQGPNNWPIYLIPDGTGDWLKTCPELHSSYLKRPTRQQARS